MSQNTDQPEEKKTSETVQADSAAPAAENAASPDVKAGNLADGIFEEGSLWVILLGGVLFALPLLPGLIGAAWTVPAA